MSSDINTTFHSSIESMNEGNPFNHGKLVGLTKANECLSLLSPVMYSFTSTMLKEGAYFE